MGSKMKIYKYDKATQQYQFQEMSKEAWQSIRNSVIALKFISENLTLANYIYFCKADIDVATEQIAFVYSEMPDSYIPKIVSRLPMPTAKLVKHANKALNQNYEILFDLTQIDDTKRIVYMCSEDGYWPVVRPIDFITHHQLMTHLCSFLNSEISVYVNPNKTEERGQVIINYYDKIYLTVKRPPHVDSRIPDSQKAFAQAKDLVERIMKIQTLFLTMDSKEFKNFLSAHEQDALIIKEFDEAINTFDKKYFEYYFPHSLAEMEKTNGYSMMIHLVNQPKLMDFLNQKIEYFENLYFRYTTFNDTQNFLSSSLNNKR